jgi:uncharacterized protein YjbI with pentapeptide repeats
VDARRRPQLADTLEPLVDPSPGDDDAWDDVEISGRLDAPDVDGLQIRDSRLRTVVLTGVTLSRTRWRNCTVERCELSGATLHGAVVNRVEFDDCRLTGCVLAEAKLSHVLFRRCRMDGAIFRMSVTSDVEFDDCDLREADFADAALDGARFAQCDLTGANFSRARMSGCDLRGSSVAGLVGGRSLVGVRIDSTQITPMALNVFSALGITVDEP